MNQEKTLNLKQYIPYLKKATFPCVTVRTTGFVFNKHCHRYFNKKDYAELFYDNHNKVIAIRPHHIDSPVCVKISSNKKKDIIQVMCTRFVRDSGILTFLELEPISDLKSKRFRMKWDEKNHWILIDLNEGGV